MVFKIEGSLFTGYIAPDKKNMGITMKFMMALKLSKLSKNVATIMPIEEIQNARIKEIAIICGMATRRISIPRNGIKMRSMTVWMIDIIAPLNAFPTTMENLDTGATSIAFISPNSLSQMMDIEEKIELNSIVIPSIPGNMNWI